MLKITLSRRAEVNNGQNRSKNIINSAYY